MGVVINRLPLAAVITAVLLFAQCSAEILPPEENTEIAPHLNPERGWYISCETHEAAASVFSGFKKRGASIVLLEADLKEYKDKILDDGKLNEIENAFNLARTAGLSVIFRAAYSFDGEDYDNFDENSANGIYPEPTEIDTILGHIEQLRKREIFFKNEDILLNVQAGFFGVWGEWHSSYYSPGQRRDASVEPQYQRQLVDALLGTEDIPGAVPKSVTVALRRPEYIRNIVNESAADTVLAAEDFDVSKKISRLAFHNDALMSDSTDMDTYPDNAAERKKEFEWINQQTRYTPMVGETNLLSGFNDAENAVDLLDDINILSLNMEYHQDVLNKWKKTMYGDMTAYEYIDMMMGYRFVVNRAEISKSTEPGGSLCLDLEIENIGFGYLLKEKKFELVVKQGTVTHRAGINEDARLWDKDEPPFSGELYFNLPSGDWDVYLSLSSTFDTLLNNPAYSVRFEGEEVTWDGQTGLNKIGQITGNGGDTLEPINF